MARASLGMKRQLPSGSWEVCVTAGKRKDGKPRRVYDTLPDEAAADARIVELAAELGRNAALARGVTLEGYWRHYKATKGQRLAKVTLARYEGCMRRAVLPALGSMDISRIPRASIQAVLLSCASHAEACQVKRSFSAVMGQAVADGVIVANPVRGRFELPAEPAPETTFDNPFEAIEGTSRVWLPQTVLQAMPLLRGTSYETIWLLMVGAGLRLEEALALEWRDVRRVEIGGRLVVQVAVYKALTYADGLKATKTRRSRRVAALAEPFGARLWELRGEPSEAVSARKASNVSQGWPRLWVPCESRHARKKGRIKGIFVGAEPPIPYVPLSRMRATHASMMQAAGVLDSLNAAAHGHAQRVSYEHYQLADTTPAAQAVGDMLAG